MFDVKCGKMLCHLVSCQTQKNISFADLWWIETKLTEWQVRRNRGLRSCEALALRQGTKSTVMAIREHVGNLRNRCSMEKKKNERKQQKDEEEGKKQMDL